MAHLSKFADLHIHTNFSDSTLSPREVVKLARKEGLAAIAICDHDSISGLKEARDAAKGTPLEIIPGIELSCEKDKSEIHILGYFIDWQDKSLEAILENLRKTRVERAKKILDKLEDFGISINLSDVATLAGNASLGRLHIARMLYKNGFVKSLDEAFRKYIGNKAPCYISGFRISPKEGIELIRRFKGIPVLAHPYLIKKESNLEEIISLGIVGIEALHSDHTPQDTKIFAEFAKTHNLLITGGSDCHGRAKKDILIGTVKLPYEYVEKLKNARKLRTLHESCP